MTLSLLEIVQLFDETLGLHDVELTHHIFRQILYKSRDIPQVGSLAPQKEGKPKLLPRTTKKLHKIEHNASTVQKIDQIASIVQQWTPHSSLPPYSAN